eukprot:837009-Rhodomonas_salina.3
MSGDEGVKRLGQPPLSEQVARDSEVRTHSGCGCDVLCRNQTHWQETAVSLQIVPGMRFLVFDFGVYVKRRRRTPARYSCLFAKPRGQLQKTRKPEL